MNRGRIRPQAARPTPIANQTSKSPNESASVRLEIAARHQIDPFRQGQLDGLCSLYAVINGLRLACAGSAAISLRESKELFALGLAFLERKGRLQKTITTGLRWRRRRTLAYYLAEAASCSGRQIIVERPSKTERSSVEDVFNWIAVSLQQNKPVLIPLMGALNHLTVVSSLSEKRLTLFDSGGFYYVEKANCSLKGSYHQIQAKGLMRIAQHPGF